MGIGSDDVQTLTTTLTNNGNGDATFTFEVVENYDATLWEITPASSTITVAAGDTRTQAFNVRSDASFTTGELEVTIGVTEVGGSSTSLQMTVVNAAIVLSVDQDLAVQNRTTPLSRNRPSWSSPSPTAVSAMRRIRHRLRPSAR